MVSGAFDVQKYRRDFPILIQQVYGKPLVYLDNAATSQAPTTVLEAIENFYRVNRSNVHRGVHHLSERATEAYEGARVKIQKFINAQSEREIIFVRGTTEGINLVASSFGGKYLKKGDEILISHMEHHSNIVPWQMICELTGANLKIIPITDLGCLDLEACSKLLGPKTKMVSLVHVSNSLGTVNPIKKIIDMAHRVGASVMIDGAQAIPHIPIDMQDLDCDFYSFSGHKVYGPTGIGVLYGKKELLENLPPYQGGGDMIRSVTFEKTTYNDLPYKFEAGTPNIAGVIGLGAAIDYLATIDRNATHVHEMGLLKMATNRLKEIKRVKIIGEAAEKGAIISFILDHIHPHDIATVLDREGVAIRAGHHCTQPVMQRFNIAATARASFAFYNTEEEVDTLVKGIEKVVKMFS